MRLLLISNSGSPLYGWCKNDIAEFAKDNKEITFISAATVYEPKEYFETAKTALAEVDLKLIHLDLNNNPESILDKAKILLVGGGNTYHLLKELKDHSLDEKIEDKVRNGIPYMGLSAGANIVGPNILTTNDWNVEGITSFDGLNLVPFSINPHYIDPHDKSVFSGESRDERILEYQVFNTNPVIGIEEKTFLTIGDEGIAVGGQGKVRLFIKGEETKIYIPNDKFQLK